MSDVARDQVGGGGGRAGQLLASVAPSRVNPSMP